MNKSSSIIGTGFKYVYLAAFFALLAGFFHPFIANTGFGSVIVGVIVLFLGLAGGILLYKAVTVDNRNAMLFGGGFTLIAISLFYIFQLTGRV